MHTDHANLTRFEYLPLERIDAKHYRWHAELVQGGCLLLYRPGTGQLHRMPDALSRHPTARDALNLARIGDWTKQRHVIRGIQNAIVEGALKDDDPDPYEFCIEELGCGTLFKDLIAHKIVFKSAADARVEFFDVLGRVKLCLLYTSPSPRD